MADRKFKPPQQRRSFVDWALEEPISSSRGPGSPSPASHAFSMSRSMMPVPPLHPARSRAAGSDGAPGGAGAAARPASDEVPWCIRAAQQVAGGGDAGAKGQRCSEATGTSLGSAAAHAEACGDELGATAQTSLGHRYRELRALRGPLEIVASIEEPQVIAQILAHLPRMAVEPHQSERPLGARAPPIPSRRI